MSTRLFFSLFFILSLIHSPQALTNTVKGDYSEDCPENSDEKKAEVIPLLFGNFDMKEKIVNLTGDDLPERDHNGTFDPVFKDSSVKDTAPIVLDDYRDGFNVTQIREYDVGMGIANKVTEDEISFAPFFEKSLVGIAATKGSDVRFERFIPSNEGIKNLKTPPLPYNVDDLEKYRNGDRVTFESRGGVIFMGGVANGPLYTGMSILAEGGWKTSVVKQSEQQVAVKVGKLKVGKVSGHLGTGIMRIKASELEELRNGFGFTFDFEEGGSPAIEAYEEALKGNLYKAQFLAKLDYPTGVEKVETFNIKRDSKEFNGAIGIPMVMNLSWGESKTSGKTMRQFHDDGSETKVNYGIYMSKLRTRFFHHHREILRAFYSGQAVRSTEEGEKQSQDERASFMWRFENDWGKSWKLKQAVSILKKDTGIDNALKLDVPKDKKLGFIRVQANMPMTDEFTQTLLNTSKDELEKEMKNASKQLIGHYFSTNLSDPLDLCPDRPVKSNNPEGSQKTQKLGLYHCKKDLIRNSGDSIERIAIAVNKMKKNQNNPKKFTRYYSKVGKEMTTNQFVFKSLLGLDDNCTVNFDVIVEGRRINRVFRSFPANQECR